MKSSTIRRSTLSKESIEVIEQLAKEQQNQDGIVEYYRPEAFVEDEQESTNKSQEIDLLWQNFKTTQFSKNSPVACVVFGFIAGVISTVLVFWGINSYMARHSQVSDATLITSEPAVEVTLEEQADMAQEELQNRVHIPTEEDNIVSQVEKNIQEPVVESTPTPVVDKSKMKKYVVKSGDTGESIIKKHYGSYTSEREQAIIKANNLKTLDRINIDQELWLP